MDKGEMLTVQQVATLLNVGHTAVYKALEERRLPFTEIYGRKVIKRSDVEAYQQRTRANGEKPKGRPKGSANRKKEAGGEVHG